MAPPRRRIVVPYLLLVAAWLLVEVLSGCDTGLLYLAPALLLGAPLLLGRYVGERRLADLAGRTIARPARRAAHVAPPRSHLRLMQRGGRLIASSLAKRPPPGRARILTA